MTRPYQRLIQSIKRVIERGRSRVEEVRLRTYWQTGRAMDRYILKYQKRAPLGKILLVRLAQDLGVTKTHLYYCLEFARAWRVFPALGKLEWTHYRILLSVNDPKLRNQLAKRAAAENWSSRVLERKIRLLKAGQDQEKVLACLTPRKGKPGTYRIVKWEKSLAIDLGFSNYHATTETKRGKFREGDIVKRRRGKPRIIKDGNRTVADLFAYEANVDRVIDADTLWARIYLGFDFWTHQKLRLRGINAPEINTPEGRKAKKFLESLLPKAGSGKTILVTTSKSDKYDRYLADIFYKGKFINQELLDKGHARLAI